MFPCKGCLVLPACSELCDTISKRNRKSSSKMIVKKICPDCGSTLIDFIYHSELSWEAKCNYCNHTFCMGGGKNLLKRLIK